MTGTIFATLVVVLMCGNLGSCVSQRSRSEAQEAKARHRQVMDEIAEEHKAEVARRQQESDARAKQQHDEREAEEQQSKDLEQRHRQLLIEMGFKHPDLRIYMGQKFGKYSFGEATAEGVNSRVDKATPEELADVEAEHLAMAWHLTYSNRIQGELNRRNVFTDEQWSQIRLGKIHIGDTSMVVLAAWGQPRDISETATALGKWTVWTYSESGSTLVQFEKGAVSLVHQ